MTPLVNKALTVAIDLHGTVKFGKSSTMIEQLKKTVDILDNHSELSGEERDVLLAAALLNKCHEPKRIDTENGKKPWSKEEVKVHFGEKVGSIVAELMTEPDEPEHLSKMEQWAIKADWAKGLSVQAQQILLAEKIINYQQTRDDPTPKWSVERHAEYLNSRQLMVDAIKEASPKLYALAFETRAQAFVSLESLAEKQKIATQKPVLSPNILDGRTK